MKELLNYKSHPDNFSDDQMEEADFNYSSEELQIINLLSSIPKTNVPNPTKRYSFAKKTSFAQQVVNFLSGNKSVTFAAVFALLLVGGFGIVRATENSLPEERLYTLKLVGEKARLGITFDQDKVASLHLALAEKRLDETKQAIETNNPEKEAAAITALALQTEKTFSAVSGIATTKAVSENDSTLLDNLVAINKEQKSVLETASKSEGTKESAEVALSVTKETDKSLAKIIATVNEQTLLDLPNKISVTGTVNSYIKNKLVVEKSTFTVNDATVVHNQTGEIVEKFDKIEGKITVIGTKDINNIVTAKKIIIIDGSVSLATDKPQVKGVVTTPKTEPKTTTSPTTTAPNTETNTTEPQKPSQTQAGFILEPTESQYAP